MFDQTMTVRASGLRECFNRIAGLIEMRIGERRNQPVRPIQIVGRDLRRDGDELFRIVTAGSGIVIAGDDGGAVVTGFFAYKNRGA